MGIQLFSQAFREEARLMAWACGTSVGFVFFFAQVWSIKCVISYEFFYTKHCLIGIGMKKLK